MIGAKIEIAGLDLWIERPGRESVSAVRERRAHHVAGVMIAGNAGKGQLQWREQTLEMLVLFSGGRIRKIAGDHHEVRRGAEFVQGGHAALQRLRSIDPAIGQHARRLDMQIGNLRDTSGF